MWKKLINFIIYDQANYISIYLYYVTTLAYFLRKISDMGRTNVGFLGS